MMIVNKRLFLLAFSFLALQTHNQELDPSILSELSPEQIDTAMELYNLKPADVPIQDLPEINETLVEAKSDMSADDTEEYGNKYGYDFFKSMPTSLAAVGDLPLPNDYKISLRDQFTIILSGSKDAIFDLNVKLDGTVLFPELGSVYVVGSTFREVKEKLSKMIEQSYIGVNIDVSLQNLSAKKITIVGAVKTPGTYLVNPFSTITGALGYSGGISKIGSLRDIKLIRNNGEIYSFDLYDLLIKGDRSNDITIEAGDTILINPASKFIEITGAVRRPAIYELLEDETINDIVEYALGFTEKANKTNISVSFLDLKAASIVTKTIQNLEQDLNSAISVNVFSYVSEETSNLLVEGAVEEPGYYDLTKYTYLSQLIDDLRFIDVYPWLGVLEQFDENNFIKSSILINLNDTNTFKDIKLLPNSRLFFANLETREFDDLSAISSALINDYSLNIFHINGNFSLPVTGSFKVKTFIDLLGLDMSSVDQQATYISPLENIIINDNYENMEFVAKKYNTISFRSPINDLIQVNISGAVEYPGTYTLRPNTTVQELYKLIDKFKDEAFYGGIVFTRENIRSRQMMAIKKTKNDLNQALLTSSLLEKNIGNTEIISALSVIIDPENLGRIAGDFSPNSISSRNTILLDGDSIFVPKNSNVINVLGEVLNPTAFEFSKNLSISKAIENAGGFQQFADKKRVYVIKANGMVEKASRNIFIGNSSLEPGDTVVVPRKTVSVNPIAQALMPITQILSDLAFSAAAVDSLSN